MPAHRNRLPLLIAALAAAVAVSVFIWWPSSHDAPDAGIVAVTPREQPQAASSPVQPEPAPSPSATRARPAIETAILASIADPGAELRGVVARRDAPQIACGEKRTSKDRGFRRFVWLGHLKMLATDDGSGAFATIAAVCREGQPVP
ncbi:hypothetical protein [Sphingomonas koreensis]